MATKKLNVDGLAAARLYAQWHLGSPDWADLIFGAYQNPGEAMDALFAESGGTIGKPIEDTEAA